MRGSGYRGGDTLRKKKKKAEAQQTPGGKKKRSVTRFGRRGITEKDVGCL